MIELTVGEVEALEWLNYRGGVLISEVEDKAVKGCFNETVIPGRRVINRLIKKGLVFMTEEEDTIEQWTPMYMLTPEGEEVLKQLFDKQ